MQKFIYISLIIIVFFSSLSYVLDEDTVSARDWNFGAETDLYFTDPVIILPIFIAAKGNLNHQGMITNFLSEENNFNSKSFIKFNLG